MQFVNKLKRRFAGAGGNSKRRRTRSSSKPQRLLTIELAVLSPAAQIDPASPSSAAQIDPASPSSAAQIHPASPSPAAQIHPASPSPAAQIDPASPSSAAQIHPASPSPAAASRLLTNESTLPSSADTHGSSGDPDGSTPVGSPSSAAASRLLTNESTLPSSADTHGSSGDPDGSTPVGSPSSAAASRLLTNESTLPSSADTHGSSGDPDGSTPVGSPSCSADPVGSPSSAAIHDGPSRDSHSTAPNDDVCAPKLASSAADHYLCSPDSPSSGDPHSPDAPSPTVERELGQHLRMLGSMDTRTKLAALKTLSKLFSQRPRDEVVEIVPQWAFEYKRLLLDDNRDVRRATNDTMSSLLTAVKEALAPHLMSLVGPWWFSKFDPAAEVAQADLHSFEAACPLLDTDALVLCVKEMFLYLNGNLKLATQALSDKVTQMDELDDMHQRVIPSSLLAMASLIDIGGDKGHSKLGSAILDSAEAALSMHNHFIDYLRSESVVIQLATYTLLTSYVNYVPRALNEEAMKILSSKDTVAIPTEQTSALLQQRFTTLSTVVGRCQAKVAELTTANLASSQAEINKLHSQAIAKDHEIDRLKMELNKVKSQSSELQAEPTRNKEKTINNAADLPKAATRCQRKRPRKPIRSRRASTFWTDEEIRDLRECVAECTQKNGRISWVKSLKHRTFNSARIPEDLKRKYIQMKKDGSWNQD